MTTPTDTGYRIGTTETLTKFVINYLTHHTPQTGCSLDPMADELLSSHTQPGIDPIQNIQQAKEALWCELGALLRQGMIAVIWPPNASQRWVLAQHLDYVRGHSPEKTVVVYKPLIKVQSYNTEEINWRSTVAEVAQARGELGLTNNELYNLFWPFHAECADNSPKAFSWMLSDLKAMRLVHAKPSGYRNQKRYFYSNGHNGNGHANGNGHSNGNGKFNNAPELPPSSDDERPIVEHVEPAVQTATVEAEEPDLFETYANVTSLKVDSSFFSTDRTFDPPITIKLCLGCPPDPNSYYLPGFTTVKIVQTEASANGRKRYVAVGIEEPFSLTLQIIAPPTK